MHSDLQPLVDAGKLTAPAARALDALPPKTYCLHKSWGFGRVAQWDLDSNHVLVDFPHKKAHAMQLAYAAETLQPIPDDHLLARKAEDPAGTKRLATENAPELIRQVLRHTPGHRANVAQVSALLVPDLFSDAEFKRWWETTKKVLRKDGGFLVPVKKTDFVEARKGDPGTGGALAARLVEQFQASSHPKDQLAALDMMAKHLDDFRDDRAKLEAVLEAASRSALQNQRLNPTRAFELLVARNEVAAAAGITLPPDAPTLATFSQIEDAQLADIVDALPASRQRQALNCLPDMRLGDEPWTARAFALLTRTHSSRVVGEIARLFESSGHLKDLRGFFDRSIRDYSITCEMLYWLCKERKAAGTLVFTDSAAGARVFHAVLSALDRDRYNDVKRGSRLRDLLLSDRELIPELIAPAEIGEMRTAARALLASPAFDELDRRSLFARLIKVQPALKELLGGDHDERQPAPLIVSWGSLAKRKQEYEDLVNKKIPENSKEIGLARSYGDLRENFEFKAAKEMQTVLMRRKAELELALARARGTNFENPDVSMVSIGTVVSLGDPETGAEGVEGADQETYTILGAWDGQPEKAILSYQTAMGQALLGHRVGEVVELPDENGAAKVVRRRRILSIVAYRGVEVTEADEVEMTTA